MSLHSLFARHQGKPGYPIFEAFCFFCLLWLCLSLPDSAASSADLLSASAQLSSAFLSLVRIFLMLFILSRAEGLPALGLRGIEWHDLPRSWAVAAGFLCALLLAVLLEIVSGTLVESIASGKLSLNIGMLKNPFFLELAGPQESFWLLLPPTILNCICVGCAEELFFRVYLIQRFKDAGFGALWACIAGSLIFGSVHIAQGAHGIISATLMGFGLSWYWEKRHNYHALALGHALYDFLVLLVLLLVKG